VLPAAEADRKHQPKGRAAEPGANSTTLSYNASVVKIYNATNSLVRFKTKHYFSPM
jgi:hypothetical protein